MVLNIQSDPELAQAILGNDLNQLQEVLRKRNHHRAELKRQQEEELVSELIDYAHSPSHLFNSSDSYSGPILNAVPVIGKSPFDLDEQSFIPD